MTIRVIGSSHHLVPPSQLREAVARREELFARLVRLQTDGRIRGAILLATCNRLEIVLDVQSDTQLDAECPHDTENLVQSDVRTILLGEHTDLACHDHAGFAAAHYLLRVATGLESMVRGEDQILGQLRDAFKQAADHGLLSAELRVLRTQLVAAARDTRQRTGISKCKVSVASLAAKQLERAGQRFAIIGAGETGRLAIESLVKRGHRDILVVNRTAKKATALADHFGLTSMSLAAFRESAPPAIDGVLIAVDSAVPILEAHHVPGVKLIVDISMPGVLDQSLTTDEPGIEIINLDGIARLVQVEGERRATALEIAADLVSGQAKPLHHAIEQAGRGSHLSGIIDQHVATAMQELHEMLDTKLRHLSEKDQKQVRQALMRVTKRNAHFHLKDVRELSGA